MFAVKADNIMKAETVMGGNKIDTAPDVTVHIVKHIAGTGQAAGQFGGLILVAFPEAANIIAVFVVPLPPAGRKSTDLIAAVADIPGFGNQLDTAGLRILPRGVQKSHCGF